MIDEIDAPKRTPGRPRKSEFVSRLSPEVIKGPLTSAQIAERERKEKQRLRGLARRAKAGAEKEIENITMKEALWEFNGKLLPEAEFTALLEKQERVWDQIHPVNDVLAGTNLPEDDPDFVTVQEEGEDLFAHVKEHGTVTMEIVLIDEHWKTPLYERFHGNDPTNIFAPKVW